VDRFYWDEEDPKKSRRERRQELEELENRDWEEPGKSRRERRLEQEKRKRKAGVAERVTTQVGPAADWLQRRPEEPRFDFIFLDADKTAYPAYYETLLPRMRPNGLLLVDNTLYGGDVVDPQSDSARAVDELNDRIAGDERVDQAMTLVADGLTFVRKR
jgi:predicted O-methyltransferase YrrM